MVFSGNLLSAVIGAVFYFSLARLAGPAGLGMFAVTLAVVVTATDLFDIALNAAIINFASREKARASTLRTALKRKLILSFGVSVGLFVLAPLAANLLSKPELTDPLRLAIWLIPSKAVFSFVRAALQAARRFVFDAAIDIVGSSLRLVFFLLGVLVIGQAPVVTALAAYAFGQLVVAAIGLAAVRKMMASAGETRHQGFTRYQTFMTVSFVTTAIAGRLDVLFLTRLTTLELVGWYQAAFRLFIPVQQLSSSLSRVFAPRFASFTRKLQAQEYTKKALQLSLGLSGAMFLTIPFLRLGIRLLYGPEYLEAVGLSYGLIWYFAAFLAATPVWSKLLYYHSNAKAFAYLALFQLAALAVFLPPAIIAGGGLGAAVTLTITNMAATLLAFRYF